MMLVSELPAALPVWIVGSAARVGCTRHRLRKPPVRFAQAVAESLFLAGRLKA